MSFFKLFGFNSVFFPLLFFCIVVVFFLLLFHTSPSRLSSPLTSCHCDEECAPSWLQSVWTYLTFCCERLHTTRGVWGYVCLRVTDGRTGRVNVAAGAADEELWRAVCTAYGHVRKSIRGEEFTTLGRWTSFTVCYIPVYLLIYLLKGSFLQ